MTNPERIRDLLFQAFIVGYANPQLTPFNVMEFFDDWYNNNKNAIKTYLEISKTIPDEKTT